MWVAGTQLRSERSPRRFDPCRLIQYTSRGLLASPLGFEPKARRFDSCLVFQTSEKFARCDSADFLKTPEDVAEYLLAAFEDGGDDAAYMAHVIGIAARAHGGMTNWPRRPA